MKHDQIYYHISMHQWFMIATISLSHLLSIPILPPNHDIIAHSPTHIHPPIITFHQRFFTLPTNGIFCAHTTIKLNYSSLSNLTRCSDLNRCIIWKFTTNKLWWFWTCRPKLSMRTNQHWMSTGNNYLQFPWQYYFACIAKIIITL